MVKTQKVLSLSINSFFIDASICATILLFQNLLLNFSISIIDKLIKTMVIYAYYKLHNFKKPLKGKDLIIQVLFNLI